MNKNEIGRVVVDSAIRDGITRIANDPPLAGQNLLFVALSKCALFPPAKAGGKGEPAEAG